MSIQEALVSMFTDDPRNWVKWGIVFAILIGGYVIAIPLYNKITAGLSWERKRDIAKSKDHIIKASLVNKHPSGEVSRYNCALPTVTPSREKSGSIPPISSTRATPPLYLYLYYIDHPDKLFSCEEYHYENHKSLILFPVIFLPWILAGIALVLLRVDLSGF